MDRQIFADVSQLSLHHPCAARGCNQTGFCSHNPASWPPDAIRGVQRLMWVTRKDGVTYVLTGRDYLGRAGRTASMLIAGFTEVSRGGVNVEDFPYPVRIGVGDAHCSEVQLAYATFWREGRDEPCVARLIPSYIFADWKEPGMHGNFSNSASILAKMANARRSARGASNTAAQRACVFAGRTNSDARDDARNPKGLFRPLRQKLSNLVENSSHVLVIDSSKTAMINIISQARGWQCFVDVKGAGFSARVPLLMHTGRPLLYVERPGLRTFHEDAAFVSPWKRHHHYIPVASDASDILQQAKWALSNMKETDRIALAALSYARCYLTAEYATLYAAVQVVTTSACAAECGSVRVCRSSSASCRARCSTCMEMAFLSRPKQLMSLISPDCHPS